MKKIIFDVQVRVCELAGCIHNQVRNIELGLGRDSLLLSLPILHDVLQNI